MSPETDDPSDLPDHPSMTLVASSLQPLSGRYGRRLLTFSKTSPFDAAESHAWRESRRGFVMAIERVSDLVWETREDRAAREGGAGGGCGSELSGSADAGVLTGRRERDRELAKV